MYKIDWVWLAKKNIAWHYFSIIQVILALFFLFLFEKTYQQSAIKWVKVVDCGF